MASKVKAKVVEAKVMKPPKKRMSKGLMYPWEVYFIDDLKAGYHSVDAECKTQNEAERYIKNNPDVPGLVIVHIDIPPMEY